MCVCVGSERGGGIGGQCESMQRLWVEQLGPNTELWCTGLSFLHEEDPKTMVGGARRRMRRRSRTRGIGLSDDNRL